MYLNLVNIELFFSLLILFLLKFNLINALKLTFSNIFISDISFQLKSKSSNSLKLTFSNIFISDILLKFKFNSSNSLNWILN